MQTIVQKFGGTSLATPQHIQRCAKRAFDAAAAGNRVVVVVSAMGKTTDELITLSRAITPAPRQRELDMLLATGEQVSTALMTMALHSLGHDAMSFAGQHLGIITDPAHTRAKIRYIDVDKLRRELDAGRIVVAAGFQGVTVDGQITTLGRGGSDTTAVALAAALGQSYDSSVTCEIFTDVDGVYTADPRKVAGARKLGRISYEEMLELASLGAGVMHNRAVMCGSNYGVPIHVRHSQKTDEGTMIVQESPEMERVAVVGCALTPDLGRISLRKIPNRPGIQGDIFKIISEAGILVDDIMQTEYGEFADMSFTVCIDDLPDIKAVTQSFLEQLGCGTFDVETGLAKVSVVGVGMRTHTGVAATMFSALGQADIAIANITTSEIKISCLVHAVQGERALNVVHDAFDLHQTPQQQLAQVVTQSTQTQAIGSH